MLTRIISGGQTGADQAALDVAIKFNIDHGGWIPKGRLTENGTLPLKYQLREMDTTDYRERTKQNILDSHGVVIISRGRLTGGSRLTQTFAKVVGRPNCYLDLLHNEEFESAIILKSFIMENGIQVLNVAGPRLSSQPEIYRDVRTILETMLFLFFLDTDQERIVKTHIFLKPVDPAFPETLEEAIDLISDDLPLKARTFIAKIEPHHISMLYFGLLEYLRHRVGFDTENKRLFEQCAAMTGDDDCTIEDAVMQILKQLKLSLEKNHILRVVK